MQESTVVKEPRDLGGQGGGEGVCGANFAVEEAEREKRGGRARTWRQPRARRAGSRRSDMVGGDCGTTELQWWVESSEAGCESMGDLVASDALLCCCLVPSSRKSGQAEGKQRR